MNAFIDDIRRTALRQLLKYSYFIPVIKKGSNSKWIQPCPKAKKPPFRNKILIFKKSYTFAKRKIATMAKNLVIVESPAKAKTIEKFLGKDFVVASSFGHIADLPTKELGVDTEGDFTPKYTVSKDKKDVVRKLKGLAKDAEIVWLASDEDREGEAIAWHLFEELNLKE